jgi:hypothetical protein
MVLELTPQAFPLFNPREKKKAKQICPINHNYIKKPKIHTLITPKCVLTQTILFAR